MRNRERHQIDFQGTHPVCRVKVRFAIGAALMFATATLPGATLAANGTDAKEIVASEGWIPLSEAKDALRKGEAAAMVYVLGLTGRRTGEVKAEDPGGAASFPVDAMESG